MQAMSLYAANSMFVSDYLTTKGQPAEDDFRMVADLGFEIVIGDHEAYQAWKASRQVDDQPKDVQSVSCHG
jgi:biotin synthase